MKNYCVLLAVDFGLVSSIIAIKLISHRYLENRKSTFYETAFRNFLFNRLAIFVFLLIKVHYAFFRQTT